MKHLLSLITLIILAAACSSGQQLPQKDGNFKELIVKYDTPIDFNKNTYFKCLVFTFENKSSAWLNIETLTLEFTDKELEKQVKVAAGYDLAAWLESVADKRKTTDDLKGLFSPSFGFTGGTNISVGLEDYAKDYNKIKREELFPQGHLFRTNVIPPGTIMQKWIVVFNRSGKVLEDAVLSITTKDKKTMKFVMGNALLYGLKER